MKRESFLYIHQAGQAAGPQKAFLLFAPLKAALALRGPKVSIQLKCVIFF